MNTTHTAHHLSRIEQSIAAVELIADLLDAHGIDASTGKLYIDARRLHQLACSLNSAIDGANTAIGWLERHQ